MLKNKLLKLLIRLDACPSVYEENTINDFGNATLENKTTGSSLGYPTVSRKYFKYCLGQRYNDQ